jgi:hypothetical protein
MEGPGVRGSSIIRFSLEVSGHGSGKVPESLNSDTWIYKTDQTSDKCN